MKDEKKYAKECEVGKHKWITGILNKGTKFEQENEYCSICEINRGWYIQHRDYHG